MASIDQLLEQVTSVTPLAIAIVALAGLVVGISPGSLPLMSVAAGFVTGQGGAEAPRSRLAGLWLSGGFALGIVTVDAIVGAVFGFIGYGAMRVFVSLLVPTYVLLTIFLLVMGLALFHVIRIPLPMLTPVRRPATSLAQAYLLGLPFGLSTCPACTPLIFPIVAAAAATADPVTGALLMSTFGVFRALPMVAVGMAAGLLRQTWRTWRFVKWFERIGGALLIAAAGYFFLQALIYARWIPPF